MEKRIYGLVGRQLGHSYSVPIHQALGNQDYRLYPMEPEALEAFLGRTDIGGLNVTIPYKQAVIPFCEGLDAAARSIGSVNTIVRQADGSLAGYNTDAAGFLYMAERAGIPLPCKKALIFGSGGASKTVQAVLRSQGAEEIIVVSRNGTDHYGNLHRHTDAELMVNATPLGMYPRPGASPADLTNFPSLRGVLDLVYNPRRTALLLQAAAMGIPCSDGLPMLVAQAKAAEEHFLGERIPDCENERILQKISRDTLNIVLIGMPGSGKSTVGASLSKLTGREAIDLDLAIERAAGRTIPEIFASDGEEAFRRLEREQAAFYGMQSGKILITGGGIVKDDRNYASLRQNGRLYEVFRDVSRLEKKGRPLSQGNDLLEMYRERKPLYERFRDTLVFNEEGKASETAEEIMRDFYENTGA